MTRAERIRESLIRRLTPARLNIVDETHNHEVPPGSESHFNVIVVAESFTGKTPVERQRMVYGVVAAELRSGLHALTMKTMTPLEWEAAGGEAANPAPPCLGGSKYERERKP